MSGRVFWIGGYVNGLKVVNQACVGWRNSKYSIGMNRKSFGWLTFTVFCSINVIDHIWYRTVVGIVIIDDFYYYIRLRPKSVDTYKNLKENIV